MCLGIPGRITRIVSTHEKRAEVDINGVRREVNVACIVDHDHPLESCIDEWVLVHVGFAMSRISEEEARLTLEVLTELGEAQIEMDRIRDSQSVGLAR
ncbi:HypC/HybG/HupF family hydrogenase formation chaperone [Acidithiobacillus caldus]|uniref:HypC/HybG/HupF family hydrogenase formation chaperone n=1 Tax=Acidithiobacillus caldus TaxID=33059 RepID=UPI0001B0D252|nr:HypC/HybG/HupF family hydrogenase formation chaperone [Acidithiobacillus caldus]MBU2730753.1 HypC/HybG/HupF family hydrogenase formation chaperone [Acidithiobacillus caldus]MBU2735715.1 HypC/HybG/HupF family hydrogenase formation chaperone [Acidithiobacillus caldus ATCC 51756]MBU2744702.1 HypC/HybG/HupF family hydrogenase formation chaperone [Acidithiobacillus caldus]MBU2764016.1 HypC/HybG/HupF family hydrogenase formation chaperone [Acidithiobacillus caldus]MBU2769928.1 HypC/HybG/HupF fami